MKSFLTLLILLTVNSLNLFSQWQPDVRLTNNSALSYTSYNNAWCVGSSGNIVHVVWSDYRDVNTQVYYKRSTDGGITWGIDTRLTNNSTGSTSPCLSVSGSVVHVVWHDIRNGNIEIYYKRSTSEGTSWEADTRLTNDTAFSGFPSEAVSGLTVHVVWEDTRNGNSNYEIYYKRSTDGGLNWGTDVRLTNDIGESWLPSIAVSGPLVHVVWGDNRNGSWEIYYKRSSDNGVSWGADIRLTSNLSSAPSASVSTSGTLVHVAWSDHRDGNNEIYYKRSSDGGVSWGPDARLTNNPASSWGPSLAVSSSNTHIVWSDQRDGNPEIYYKRSTDRGSSWGADTRLTNNSAVSENPSVSLSGSIVHIVWDDNRDSNNEIYYKRDPTGNPIGIININSQIPKKFSLSQNYPNPFNPGTKFKIQISKSGNVRVNVFDIVGREVETRVNEQLKPGTYEVEWDASNYPTGVYYYRLSAADYSETRKMVLIK